MDARGDCTGAGQGVIELSRDEWDRLTRLVHEHGSVAALERVSGTAARADRRESRAGDVTAVVRREVAEQLAAALATKSAHAPSMAAAVFAFAWSAAFLAAVILAAPLPAQITAPLVGGALAAFLPEQVGGRAALGRPRASHRQ